MSEVEARKPQESLQERLAQVVELLHQYRFVEGPAHDEQVVQPDEALHEEGLSELRRRLDELHPADIAFILEALPLHERLTVWSLVKTEPVSYTHLTLPTTPYV